MSFLIISILKLCFCSNSSLVKTASSYKGSRDMCWHVYTQALLKTTGADDDCSLGEAFDRHPTDDSIGIYICKKPSTIVECQGLLI